MRFVRELAEPWGVLLAATSAGAAWAVQLPGVAAIGVGLVVLAARAGIAVASRRAQPPETGQTANRLDGPEPVGPVTAGSPEAGWLLRAERAVAAFGTLSASLRTGPIHDRITELAPQARETVQTLRRLAGRASAVATALRQVDAPGVERERARLAGQLDRAEPDVRSELEASLAAVQDRLGVHERLAGVQRRLLARLESGALGLESLLARAVELTAAPGEPLTDHGAIRDLTDQLEGLRRGVVETEEATRRSLG